MRYFSTFTGIGGFEIGIHNAYRNKNGGGSSQAQGNNAPNRKGLQWPSGQNFSSTKGWPHSSTPDPVDDGPLCVGYSEIDPYAIKIYEKHFKGAKNYGDITKINAEELPDFDCLVGGFPCQAFSVAGLRRGFEDTRGTLFFDLARILQAKQPRLFVFENVKGLLSHDSGNTFRTIIATITELGYDCQWQVLNSKDFGVPQNRERIIIVGHLRGTPRPQVFPILPASYEASKEQLTSTTIDANYWKGIDNHGARTAIVQLNSPVHSNDRIYSPDGISPTLNKMQGGNRQPFVAFGRDGVDSGAEIDPNGVREASSVSRPVDTMSDTQRYKMAGNAVTTNVIQAVFERIFS